MPSGPYAWLMTIVPGFTGVRVPARFTLVATLCLSMAAAILIARLRQRWIGIAVAAIALMEVWLRPIPLWPLPPLLDAMALTPTARAVLELPVGNAQEFPALYRSMFHRRPLVNGYSGYTPRAYDELRGLSGTQARGLPDADPAGRIDPRCDRSRKRSGPGLGAVRVAVAGRTISLSHAAVHRLPSAGDIHARGV